MAKKNRKLTKAQLEILFECWKNGNNTKEWLDLITKNLPKIPSLVALSIMRRMIKTDVQWQKAATRKKNKKEKEKREKKAEREKKRAAAVQKKQEREKRLAEKNKEKAFKEKIRNIKQSLKIENTKDLSDRIGIDYFFCSDVDQYVNNISCIFRLFSDDYSILLDSKCDKCQKMNKYIPILEEIISNARPKKTRRDRAGESGSKAEKEKSAATKRTGKTSSNS